MQSQKNIIMQDVLSDPAYKGKHVIVVSGKIFTANTGEGAAKILEEVDRQFPNDTAEITYIPDADTLILLFGGTEKVYFLPKIKVRLGNTFEREIPVGFLDRNEVPPLMGRHLFMETFETYFSSEHVISFSENVFEEHG